MNLDSFLLSFLMANGIIKSYALLNSSLMQLVTIYTIQCIKKHEKNLVSVLNNCIVNFVNCNDSYTQPAFYGRSPFTEPLSKMQILCSFSITSACIDNLFINIL